MLHLSGIIGARFNLSKRVESKQNFKYEILIVNNRRFVHMKEILPIKDAFGDETNSV